MGLKAGVRRSDLGVAGESVHRSGVKSVLASRFSIGLILTLAVGLAFWLRVGVPYSQVVVDDGAVVFPHVDPWYHARLQAALAENFPLPVARDPYAVYPGGQHIPVAPLFDGLIVATALIAGGGSISQQGLESVAIWIPPLMAFVTLWLVYLIGRRLLDPLAAALAVLLLAVVPREFLLHTLLGAIDHHAAEVMFSTAVLWALVALLQASFHRKAALRHVAVPGVLLAAYLASWSGGSLVVAILVIWLALQHLLDVRAGRDTRYLRSLGAVALIAMGLIAPLMPWIPRGEMHLAALAVLAAVPWVMGWWLPERHIMGRRLVIGAMLVAGVGIGAWILAPQLLAPVVEQVVRLWPSAHNSLVGEAMSLVVDENGFSPALLWEHYGIGVFLFIGAMLGWALDADKRQRPEAALLWVWSLAFLLATLGQRRFGYYLAPAMVVVLVYGLEDLAKVVVLVLRAPSSRRFDRLIWVSMVLALGAGWWQQGYARLRAGVVPANGWLEATSWLRASTPEPFAEGGACYTHSTGCGKPDYCILAPWDAGYWIVHRGRRIPIANPTQSGLGEGARAFLADAGSAASTRLSDLGARYVMVDDRMAVTAEGPDDKAGRAGFDYLVRGAGLSLSDFMVEYRDQSGGSRIAYLPPYYRSLATRLYLLGTAGIEPKGPVLMLAKESEGPHLYRMLESYGQARALQTTLITGDWLIGCPDPLISCVPLEPVPGLRLVFESDQPSTRMAGSEGTGLPEVRVYERVADEAE